MSGSLSDPYLLVAFWAGVIAIALTLAVSVIVVTLRIRLRIQDRRWERFVAQWRPVLLSAMLEVAPAPFPPLKPAHAVFFLRLWAYLHESVRGESARRLNESARLLRVDAIARRLLERGNRAEKLLAILSVGHLRDVQAWEPLLKLAQQPDGLISVNAARSMIQIDPLRAAQSLITLIVRRVDWDVARVAGFLGEAREAFWLLLVKGILDMPESDLVRALKLAESLRLSLPLATLRFLLDITRPVDVVVGALRIAGAQDVGPEVRVCLAHPHWRVREQAARRMERMATPSDVPALTALLDDAEWPVRLAVAHTLAELPFVNRAALERLAHTDSPAKDILMHVLSERAPA